MKKIMKKALSLMLALVMVFSLAPMTANAATGDSETPAELAVDGSVLTSEYTQGGTAYFYTYTPSTNGTLTLTAETEDVFVTIQGGNLYNYIDYNPSAGFEVETIDVAVTAGTTYSIVAMTSSYATGTVSFSATFVEGAASSGPTGATIDDAINLTGEATFTLSARSTKYFYITGYAYGSDYTLTVDGGKAAGMNGGVSVTTYFNANEIETKVGDTAVDVYAVGNRAEGGSIYFSVTNPGFYDCEYQFNVVEGKPSAGVGSSPSDADPELTLGEVITKELDGNMYWYTWTATEAGTFSFTLLNDLCADGWVYQVDGYSPYSTAWGEEDRNVCEVSVVAGDTVVFGVWVPTYLAEYDAWDAYTPGSGTVYFSATFTTGTVGEGDGDGEGGTEGDGEGTPTEGVITPGEDDANYAQSTAPIVVGDNLLSVSNDYAYTIFTFEPTEEGLYTFTSEDSVMGIVSNNGMWITVEPSADTVASNEIEWECSGVGQSIWIAVMAETNVANITVEWEEVVATEIPSENAYPTISLETYVFDGDLAELDRFMYGLADGEIDAVLGEDNYYHVVDVNDIDEETGEYIGEKPLEDCPVVLVKLNDSVLSLAAAIGYGNVKWVSYDENGDAQYIIYFNEMIEEYLTYTATDDKLYPLTADLLTMMILAGEDQGWYEEDGFIALEFEEDQIPAEYLFSFAMYYLDQDITTLDPEEPVVDKEVMEDIIANNANKDTVISTTVKNEAGEDVTVKFEFAANTMKPVEGKEEYSFEVELVATIDDATAEKAEISKDNFVLRINFEYDGKLPAEATITIPVGTAYATKTLYYYQILADGTLEYVCDAPVDANGNAKVTQDHCSDYVLLAEKIAEPAPEAPKTGDATNFALWIAILGLGVAAIAGSVVMKKREF